MKQRRSRDLGQPDFSLAIRRVIPTTPREHFRKALRLFKKGPTGVRRVIPASTRLHNKRLLGARLYVTFARPFQQEVRGSQSREFQLVFIIEDVLLLIKFYPSSPLHIEAQWYSG